MTFKPEGRFLVLGAGPAGSSAALTLARAGFQVHLVEQSRFDQPRVGELLSPEGQVWVQKVLPRSYQKFFLTQLGVVGAWTNTELCFFSPPSWWALDRTGFDRALAQEAHSAGADLQLGSRVRGLVRRKEVWRYSLGTQEFEADWLIVASGRGGVKAVSAEVQRFDRQIALVGLLEGDYRSSNDMLLESNENGWWYGAPIDPQRAVAVFVTDSDLDKGDPHEIWRLRLSESLHAKQRFESMSLLQKPKRVAAGYSLLRPAYGPGWAAVGEAAAAFCPLSSMGVGRAVEMGVRLGECFVRATEQESPPNLLAFSEQNGAEFHLYHQILSNTYRQVFHFPRSVFWARRATEGEGSLRFRARASEEINFIFPEKQNFECSRCGKCCASNWLPLVGSEQREALGKVEPRPGYLPLRVFEDGRVAINTTEEGRCVFLGEQEPLCTIHETPLKPQACQQFPFILKDTPDGVVVGVSFLCTSVQKNTGLPVSHYKPQLLELLARRDQPVLSRHVPVCWGRNISWEQYEKWESDLVKRDNVVEQIRMLRWRLPFWLRGEEAPERVPREELHRLEFAMAMYLLASLEGACALDATSGLASELILGRTVALQCGWNGSVAELLNRYQVERSEWVLLEVERFLKALIQRKYLLSHAPLAHKLNLLAAMPRLLEFYTAHAAWQSGSPQVEKPHLFKAFDSIELGVAAHSRQDILAQAFFHWHMRLAGGEPSYEENQKSLLYGYCFEPPAGLATSEER